MDNAKRMMEKWGWNKGQGLGKNKTGITSHLVLRKQDGSSTQGRIMMSKPSKEAAQSAAGADAAVPVPADGFQRDVDALMEAASMAANTSSEPEAKRPKSDGEAGSPTTQSADVSLAASLFDIDPRDVAAAAAAAQAQVQAQLLQLSPGLQFPNLMALGAQVQDHMRGATQAESTPSEAGDRHVPLAKPRQRVRVRQFVQDDWRWSKGTEALRYFEEVTLAPSLLELAKKILGAESRYPARIADDTDCVTEVTAWGTLLVRPRGTGANITLAKRMLYEVLHPSGESLREDCLITPDEMAEAAVRDQSTITAGGEELDWTDKLSQGVKRSFQGDLRRVGLGAEDEVIAEALTGGPQKADSKTITLATAEDARLVARHLDDLRVATNAIVLLTGVVLRILGKDRAVKKAENLVLRLVETGSWVALTDGFVHAQEEQTREQKRAVEGPATQILIKIPEGPVTAIVERHIKVIERAAIADTLKLTSKAVQGKRTLMVDGSKASQERVKLMVKEIAEFGASPMLTKAINQALGAPPVVEVKQEPVSHVVAPGVIAAPPVLITDGDDVKEDPAPNPAVKDEHAEAAAGSDAMAAPVVPGLGPGPAMRHLPAPRLIVDFSRGESLFSGLPVPDFPLFAGLPAATSAGAAAVPAAAVFPPMPPGIGSGAGIPGHGCMDNADALFSAAIQQVALGSFPPVAAAAEELPGITE